MTNDAIYFWKKQECEAADSWWVLLLPKGIRYSVRVYKSQKLPRTERTNKSVTSKPANSKNATQFKGSVEYMEQRSLIT
jgi:hypothetical protein